MSKLDDLIKKLCPNGVEFHSIEDVADVARGVRVVRSQLADQGSYPVFQNSLTPMGYYEKQNCNGDTAFIIAAGAAGEIGYSYSDFWAADDCYFFKCSKALSSRYLYHMLLWKQPFLKSRVRKASIPRLSRDHIEQLSIPVPPLPVQEEIVRILDSFTKLEAELEAELEARRRQYEYYRDKLLSFNELYKAKWGGEVKLMALGEIGPIRMCKRIMKSETSSAGEIPFFKIGTFGQTADAYISKEKYEEYKKAYPFPKKGDILISAAGTIGRTVVYDGKPAYYQDSNIVWIDNDEKQVLNTYLFYYYSLKPWNVSTGGTIARLYNDNLAKAKIKVPSIEKQKHIVSIIDKFDSLVNDLTSGLPAEIKARRQQYEYYRDKLLTFSSLQG